MQAADWLRDKLAGQSCVCTAYIFGSSLDPYVTPNDVDLVIVTDNIETPAWHDARSLRDTLTEEFEPIFGLPLSAIVSTPGEWNELDGTIVRERLQIV